MYQCDWTNPSADNQLWYFAPTPQGFAVINEASGAALDVSGWASNGSDLSNDLPLTLYYQSDPHWANAGWDDHEWRMYPAVP